MWPLILQLLALVHLAAGHTDLFYSGRVRNCEKAQNLGIEYCAFPFQFKGKIYNGCTNEHTTSGLFWCGLTYVYKEWCNCDLPNDDVNIALHRPAYMSSTSSIFNGAEGVASLAVDDDKQTGFPEPCLSTNNELYAWWAVDLRLRHVITKVAIRSSVLSNFIIAGAYDDPTQLTPRDQSMDLCYSSYITFNEINQSFNCSNPTLGRYVIIQLQYSTAVLTLCEVQVYGYVVDNLALNKPAYQSSTAYHGQDSGATLDWDNKGATLATDGIANPIFLDGSCTHTVEEMNPWWTVDLLHHHYVHQVVLTNRGDRHHIRLERFSIGISEKIPTGSGPISMDVCVTQYRPLKKQSRQYQCRRHGRYVTVTINARQILTLCEVEIYGGRTHIDHTLKEVNLALYKPTLQSSTYGEAVSSRAVDGNFNHNFYYGSCVHTTAELDPWFSVNLMGRYWVETVFLWNKCSNCIKPAKIKSDCLNNKRNPVQVEYCQIPFTLLRKTYTTCTSNHSFSGKAWCSLTRTYQSGQWCFCEPPPPDPPASVDIRSTVQVGTSLTQSHLHHPGLNTCDKQNNAADSRTVSFQCAQPGQWVTIYLHNTNPLALSLCEVEVFGRAEQNLALDKHAVQSSTYQNYGAHLAVDGDRNTFFSAGSCTKTNNEAQPWWAVDLGSVHHVLSVELTNGDQLRNTPSLIDIGTMNVDPAVTRPSSSTGHVCNSGQYGMRNSETRNITCRSDGRYVYVMLRVQRTQILTLCEVAVYGWEVDDAKDTDECLRRKIDCNGHGRCKSFPNSYDCICEPGWLGDDCEVAAPGTKACSDADKEKAACLSDSSCVEVIVGGNKKLLCRCQEGWTGNRCQLRDPFVSNSLSRDVGMAALPPPDAASGNRPVGRAGRSGTVKNRAVYFYSAGGVVGATTIVAVAIIIIRALKGRKPKEDDKEEIMADKPKE